MADQGMSITQANAAGAYARAEVLGVSIPVRPADPIRQRFQLQDDVAADQADSQARSAATDADEQSAAGSSGGGSQAAGGGLGGLLGAFTSFLARFFGQTDATVSADATTAMKTGTDAYTRAAGPGVSLDGDVEVLSPSFPRLSSGRALDLTV